jgi:hypothetical protein
LVLQFPVTSDSDFDKLVQLEDEIEAQIGSEHEVDGHDFGSGEMNLFIFTNNVTEAFARIQKITSMSAKPGLKVAFRHVYEEEYHLLWPNEEGGTFEVL